MIGVVVGVAGWSALTIVLVMGLALGVVLLLEWVAARERAIPHAAAPAAAPDLDREEPAELPVGESWVPPEEGPEALTMLDHEVVEVVAEAEPEAEPEPEPEPSPSPSPSPSRSSPSPSRSSSSSRSRSRSPSPSPSRSEPAEPEAEAVELSSRKR